MFRFSIIFFTLILFFACGNNKANEQENKTIKTTQQTTTAQTPSQDKTSLPSIPLERMQFMWQNCDYIDYIFNDLPISMSQDEKAGIQNSLRYISEKPASTEMLTRCNKSIGNVLYHYNGEIVHEAEIHFSEGCNFYVFLDKQRKPVYSNMMTSSGVNFLAQMVKGVTK